MTGLRTPMQSIIIETLSGVTGLFPSPFDGGISDVLPKAGSGPGATPGMFYDGSNPLEAGKLKPVVCVLDGGDVPAPNGVGRNGYAGYPLVYAFVRPDVSGGTALQTLDDKLHLYFDRGISYLLPGTGRGVEIIALERQLLRDGEDFGTPDRKFAIWRLQAIYLKKIPT
jgi:hypothetical protein